MKQATNRRTPITRPDPVATAAVSIAMTTAAARPIGKRGRWDGGRIHSSSAGEWNPEGLKDQASHGASRTRTGDLLLVRSRGSDAPERLPATPADEYANE